MLGKKLIHLLIESTNFDTLFNFNKDFNTMNKLEYENNYISNYQLYKILVSYIVTNIDYM